jgi:hypothetical protein
MTTSGLGVDIPKLDDEDPSSGAVLCDLEKIDDAHKPGLPRELGSDIGEGDLEDPRDENLAGRERVSAADLHVWSLPQPDGGGDFAATNAIAERSEELHGQVSVGIVYLI